MKKALLTLTVAGLAVAILNVQPALVANLGAPISVVAFGMYLILKIWEKESALYDQQHSALVPIPARKEISHPTTTLTTAHSS